MSHRVTITYICDHCGLQSSHEKFHAGYTGDMTYTMETYPAGWVHHPSDGMKVEKHDYCPSCAKLRSDKNPTIQKQSRPSNTWFMLTQCARLMSYGKRDLSTKATQEQLLCAVDAILSDWEMGITIKPGLAYKNQKQVEIKTDAALLRKYETHLSTLSTEHINALCTGSKDYTGPISQYAPIGLMELLNQIDSIKTG